MKSNEHINEAEKNEFNYGCFYESNKEESNKFCGLYQEPKYDNLDECYKKQRFDIINKAIVFATQAHTGQYRKGTEMPYIVHPLEAGVIAASMTNDENVIAAAFLHDTIEDTQATENQLKNIFGEEITKLVLAESENKRKGTPEELTWKERKQETINYLSSCTDERVKIIAISDKLANARNIKRDYFKLGENLWLKFNQNNPAELKWYYESFIETCSCLKETEAYKEYCKIISEVFEKY